MSDQIECRIEPGPKCEALQKLIAKSGIPLKDIKDRSIVCTASRAHYGRCSHWIISVEGTPPRGTIIFDTNRYTPGTAFLLIQETSKRLSGKSYEIVSAFVSEFLAADE
jgi:hypothetical protein